VAPALAAHECGDDRESEDRRNGALPHVSLLSLLSMGRIAGIIARRGGAGV